MNDNQVIQDLDQTKIYKNLREVERRSTTLSDR